MTAFAVMLAIVIAFLVVAALIARADEAETDEDADTRVWRRLIDMHDQDERNP